MSGSRDEAPANHHDPSGAGAHRRLRVLVSAFACQPGGISEEAVGWNVVQELGRRHDVWVLTTTKHQQQIQEAVAAAQDLTVTFRFVPTTRLGELGTLAFNLDYYLWQARAYVAARKLAREVPFDVAHHLTYGRYWTPSALSLLPIPYVLGPVGGGESVPRGLRSMLDRSARRFEAIRSVARRLGESDPWVRRTVRRSGVALASTQATAKRLRALGAKDVRVLSPLSLNDDDVARLTSIAAPERPFRAICVGRMLHWKGFDLALRAFARADLPAAELWLVGDGPYVPTLKSLARDLGVDDRVVFFGGLDHATTLDKISSSHVLVHPSLHESAGFVCLEAMAAGLPVISLAWGGPGELVQQGGGVAVTTRSPEDARDEIATALTKFARAGHLSGEASSRARAFAHSHSWPQMAGSFEDIYRQLIRGVRA